MKKLVIGIAIVLFAGLATTVSAGKPEPLVVDGCLIAPRSQCEGANLANLTMYGEGNLTGWSCLGCNMYNVGIVLANLSRVNLSGSDLTDAHLIGSDLRGAILRNTNLTRTNFNGVKDFSSVDFTGAIFCQTVMPDASINNRDCPTP